MSQIPGMYFYCSFSLQVTRPGEEMCAYFLRVVVINAKENIFLS